MAIGCAALFGLPLPQNFNLPFLATSMLEFWRRWHMTLTSWLFDYVYSPLVTGDGRMRGRFDLGFLTVFAVSGLWHGATWAFVLWGALHGVALAAHRRWDEFYRGLCRKDRAWVARRKTPAYLAAAWAVTQAFFLLSLVPFRAGTLPAAGHFARGLVTSRGDAALDVGHTQGALRLAVSVGLLVAWHLLGTERFRAWRDRLLGLPAPVRGLAYGLLAVYLALFMPLTGAAFIYAQF
jgi:alginate O-acetyltransferase complex protein AlgI